MRAGSAGRDRPETGSFWQRLGDPVAAGPPESTKDSGSVRSYAGPDPAFRRAETLRGGFVAEVGGYDGSRNPPGFNIRQSDDLEHLEEKVYRVHLSWGTVGGRRTPIRVNGPLRTCRALPI
jgi:hypothetical protein